MARTNEPVAVGRNRIPVPRWQQTRLVEEPAVGRIQRPAYETDAPKSVLPRFIQAAQHDGIDDVAIALQQRTGDRHAHIRRHCGIDVEQVESANLSAISTRTLIDGHQHFGIDLLVAKGEDGAGGVRSGKITPADVGEIAACSQMRSGIVNGQLHDLLGRSQRDEMFWPAAIKFQALKGTHKRCGGTTDHSRKRLRREAAFQSLFDHALPVQHAQQLMIGIGDGNRTASFPQPGCVGVGGVSE